jgi:Phosphatidylinositol-4-phosphate 5-Kinase
MVVSEDIGQSTPNDILRVSHTSMPKMMATDKNIVVRSRLSCNDEENDKSSSKQKLDILAQSH